MRRIAAIATLAVRNAVRSRVFLMLLVLLVATIVLLPRSVQGDGTLEGRLQVLIRYTLGLSSFILALATLWSGCAAVSQEIETRQIHLLVSKPVRRAEIWIGKWLGLMAMNTVLLTVCALVVYGSLRRDAPVASWAERRDLLQSKRVISPKPMDVEAAAQNRLRDVQKAQSLPSNMSEASALKLIRRDLLIRAHTVAPGASLRQELTLPATVRAPAVTLQYRLRTSQIGQGSVTLRWRVTGLTGPPIEVVTTNVPERSHHVRVPVSPGDGGRTLVVDLLNQDTRTTALFEPDEGLLLLVPEDAFAFNLLRATLVLWCRLALLAAVGVSAGSLLSLPVAAVVALLAVVLIQFNGYVRSLTEGEVLLPWHDPRQVGLWSERIMQAFFHGLRWLIAPLQQRDVLGALASGHLVSWIEAGQTLLVYVLLFGGLVAILGTLLFNRRELGMPEA